MARHRITLKQVSEVAGLNYSSVKTNMSTYLLSEERMGLLEEAAIKIHDQKTEPQTA